MSETDFATVCGEIDKKANFLNEVSQEIWNTPELGLEEVHAHDTLTGALEKCGFNVQRNYILPTAFKGEYSSKTDGGPVIAILLEYDALPDIGHACGHNLIAEAGLAAGIVIKVVMEEDPTLLGKVLLLGTPAEESQGGKIKLINAKAFEGVDAALMVHPSNFTSAFAPILSTLSLYVDFYGKESHAAAFPWEGCNALDAAVACYQSLALLRQQIKPSCRIHAIITKGGTKTNIIPAHTSMEIRFRAATKSDLKNLNQRILTCIRSSAETTGCTSTTRQNEETMYESVLTNKILAHLFEDYSERLGMVQVNHKEAGSLPVGSTDMGNVSRLIPSIHPFYAIATQAMNHTKDFTKEAGSSKAQEPTLKAAKAMALTALKLMRCPKTLAEAKKQFEADVIQDMLRSIF